MVMEEEEEEFAIIASINPLHLQDLALTTRGNMNHVSCTVSNPPRMGSFNIVYEVVFSDGPYAYPHRVTSSAYRAPGLYTSTSFLNNLYPLKPLSLYRGFTTGL
jgi:hypothetical protein